VTSATAYLLLPGAYLLGSIPTGLLVARARGVDVRTVGSGNIGATNVARAVGKPLAALVLLADAAKGFLPPFLGARVLHAGPWVIALAGFLAILGHVFPLWLRFRGGKGVATALGVFLALAPLAAAVGLATYLLAYAGFRISSLGSMLGATALLVTMACTGRPVPSLALGAAAWLLIMVRHRGNIQRLLQRRESKV
jgi:acyl phosphate:glycerol-3-phosphate acyltransferase